MACVMPIDCWKSQRLNESGKRSVTFSKREGYEDMHLQVPCGKCIGCMADKSLLWSIRCYHEASLHERNCFVTLTYSDPPPEKINKQDLQKFFKRLRHHGYTFRYFACGEYGSVTHRPHYHAIIFGEDFMCGHVPINDNLYTNPFLESIWNNGIVSIGQVEMASCCYVAGYATKKIGDKDTFNLMSRKPGIGFDWLEKYRYDLIRTGHVVIEGKEYPIPRRYLEWFDEEFKEVRKERAKIFQDIEPEKLLDRRDGLINKEINKFYLNKLREEKI